MKKITAILLAMLMLLSMAAFAEEAMPTSAIMNIANLNATVTQNGQAQNFTAGDLDLTLALDATNAPTLLAEFANTNEALATFCGMLDGSRVVVFVNDQDHAYAEDLPQQFTSQVPMDQLPAVVQMIIPMLDQVVLPPISGISIPKVDMTGVLAPFMDGDSFEIPYETVMGALESALEAGKQNVSSIEQLSQAIEAVSQLKDMGIGAAIRGTVTDDGSVQTTTADVLLASDGQVSDEAIAQLVMNSSDNNLEAALNVQGSDMATLKAIADPATSELNVEFGLMGQVVLSFGIYGEDGLQKLAFDMQAPDQNMNLEFGYGQQNGMDVVALSGSFASAGSFACTLETAMGADGTRTGTLSFNVDSSALTVTATADVTMYLGSLGLDVTLPEDIRPFSEFNQDEISAAMQPVTDYVATVQQAA